MASTTNIGYSLPKYLTSRADSVLNFSWSTLSDPKVLCSAICTGIGGLIVWNSSHTSNNSISKTAGLCILIAGTYKTNREYYRSKIQQLNREMKHLKSLKSTEEWEKSMQKIQNTLDKNIQKT